MDQAHTPALFWCTVVTAKSTAYRKSSISENGMSEEEPRFTPATLLFIAV
jgi:hypothetical protein